MKKLEVLRSVLFAALVLATARAQSGGEVPEEDGCMRNNEPEVIRQARIEAVKRDILLKLNLLKPPKNPPNVPVITNQAILDEYEALVIAQEARRKNGSEGGGCTQYNQYAAKVLAFFPTEAKPVYSPHHISDMDADEGNITVCCSIAAELHDAHKLQPGSVS